MRGNSMIPVFALYKRRIPSFSSPRILGFKSLNCNFRVCKHRTKRDQSSEELKLSVSARESS